MNSTQTAERPEPRKRVALFVVDQIHVCVICSQWAHIHEVLIIGIVSHDICPKCMNYLAEQLQGERP